MAISITPLTPLGPRERLKTRAPVATNFSAVARPMPLLAPEITMFFIWLATPQCPIDLDLRRL